MQKTDAPGPTSHVSSQEWRVLVLAPFGSDADLMVRMLEDGGIRTCVCGSIGELAREVPGGVGTILVTQEALSGDATAALTSTLDGLPPWSEVPLLILTPSESDERLTWEVARRVEGTAHLTLLERPLRKLSLLSAVRAALESRAKQYRVRDELNSRRKVEAELRESQERLELAQRVGALGVFDWDISSGKVLWSRGIGDIFGEPGGPTKRDYADRARFVHPDDLEGLEALFARWFEGKHDEERWEYRILHRDGSQRWLTARARLFRDDEGAPVRMLGVNVDITDRKEMEEELQRLNRELRDLNEELEKRIRERTHELARSEAKYRSLVENTGDIPFHLDADGRIQYAGPQVERYGLSQRGLRGVPLPSTVSQEDQETVRAATRRMMEQGESEDVEFRIAGRDGGEVWLEARGTIMKDASGAVSGLTGVLRDITERKKMEAVKNRREAQLRHLAGRLAMAQDQEQRRIALGLHDDVAQILAACSIKLATAERAGDMDQMRAAQEEAEELLEEASEKVRTLSFELFSSTLARMGLRAGLEEMCETLSQRFDIRLHLRGDGDGEGVGEALQIILFKSVRELLFNVVKHAQVDEAQVTIHREGGILTITVEDHGVGFPRTPDGARIDLGRGLGLFSIRERIEDLGGGIRIESEASVLTRVSLWIPVEEP